MVELRSRGSAQDELSHPTQCPDRRRDSVHPNEHPGPCRRRIRNISLEVQEEICVERGKAQSRHGGGDKLVRQIGRTARLRNGREALRRPTVKVGGEAGNGGRVVQPRRAVADILAKSRRAEEEFLGCAWL